MAPMNTSDNQVPFAPMATTVPFLRYVIAIADQGSFRAAAEALYIAQPSLSAAIAKWEKQLGVNLFERGGRGIRVTPSGEAVVAAARQALAAIEAVESAAAAAVAPFYGPLRLGVIPTVGPYALPIVDAAIHQLQQEYRSDISLSVRERTTDQLLAELDNGKIDVALLAQMPGMEQRFDSCALYQEPFVVAVSEDHAWASRETLAAEELASQRLLLLDEGHCLRDQALALCSLNAKPQQDAYRATSLETLRQLVRAGHGVTLLPALATRGARDGLVFLPLVEPAQRDIILLWRRNDPRAEHYRLLQQPIRQGLPKRLVQC